MSDKYFKIFDEFFSNVEKGTHVYVDEIYDSFDVQKNTIKKYLKQYISNNSHLLLKIVGFYPDVETIINLAEKEINSPTNANNLYEINKACKKIIDSITLPIHEKFLRDLFNEKTSADGLTITCPTDEFIKTIYDNYSDFITESGNSIVSIAGRMNEEILLRGLTNSGLTLNSDYVRTGKESDADLKVFHNGKSGQSTLYVEVKSYHARERFLRALRDIPHPSKIGVGFFISPKEFNPNRSALYAQAGAWAIYMPDETLNQIDKDSLEVIATNQSSLYRPLSRFCFDMVEFNRSGLLPKFKNQ